MRGSQFLSEVRRALENKSSDSLKEIILQIVKFIPRDSHEDVLSIMKRKLKLYKEEEENIDLIKLVKNLLDEIENGEYSLEWQYTEGYEDGYWSEDNVLVDNDDIGYEIDKLLEISVDYVKKRRYYEAIQAFDMLFNIEIMVSDGEYDDLDFDGMFDNEMLKSDAYDICAHYAYACIAFLKGYERLDKLFDIERFISYDLLLSDIASVNQGILPDKEQFIKQWIDYLMEFENISENMLLDAIKYSGGIDALEAFTLKNGKRYKTMYVSLMELLIDEKKYERAINIAKDAFEKLKVQDANRIKVSDKLLEIGEIIKDEDIIQLAILEGFKSSLDLKHFINLYNLGDKDAIQKNIEYMDSIIKEQQVNSAYINTDYYYIHFLNGDYKLVWDECKKNKKFLGLSGTLKGAMIPLFIWLVSKGEKLNSCTEKLMENNFNLRGDFGKFAKILSDSFRELNKEEYDEYLKWCVNEIDGRVAGIVGEQHRGSYPKASALIVSMAESIRESDINEAVGFIKKYKEKYPRHSAFQRCLSEDILLGNFYKYIK